MSIVDIGLLLMAISALFAIGRACRGPTPADRLVAAEFGFITVVGAIVLVEMRRDFPLLLDLALVAVLIGFLTTISLARLVTPERREL